MPWLHTISIMPDHQTVRAECGPMGLAIKAFDRNGPRTDIAREGALQGIHYLERIARRWPGLCRPAVEIEWYGTDHLVQAMIAAARAVGDGDLTPMAAVAGTLADGVADWLVKQGMIRVMVDNGGDLAIRLAPGETASVGVRTDVRRPEVTHILELDDRSLSWGVTTSGLGGRSYTRGIASAVTAVAHRASFADAASTAIANACRVSDPAIRQVPARKLDPGSDIPDLRITVGVEGLPLKSLQRAMTRAVDKSNVLTQRGIVVGSLIAAGGLISITQGLKGVVAASEARPGIDPGLRRSSQPGGIVLL